MTPVDLHGTRATRVRERIADLAGQGLAPLELLSEVQARVETVVPSGGGAWIAIDPETVLPTGVVAFGGGGADLQSALFRNELCEPDLNKFADVFRLPQGVTTLHSVTGGHPELSARHALHERFGLGDELRAAFRADGSAWGVACMSRASDAPPFSAEETKFVASLADGVGRGLRAGLGVAARAPRAPSPSRAPGMLVLDEVGGVELATPEARRWLESLPAEATKGTVPSVVMGVVLKARAHALGLAVDVQPARARVATREGEWLVVHASLLRDEEGRATRTAVMLEPAEPAQILGLMLKLHGLSARERQVTELLVRGLATDEIAAELFISRHTLRDHVKAVFAKLAVTSRPELTALLAHEPLAA